jgi:hypothetical protein
MVPAAPPRRKPPLPSWQGRRLRLRFARTHQHFLFGDCIKLKIQPDGKIRPKPRCNFEANSAISGVANLGSERLEKQSKMASFMGRQRNANSGYRIRFFATSALFCWTF